VHRSIARPAGAAPPSPSLNSVANRNNSNKATWEERSKETKKRKKGLRIQKYAPHSCAHIYARDGGCRRMVLLAFLCVFSLTSSTYVIFLMLFFCCCCSLFSVVHCCECCSYGDMSKLSLSFTGKRGGGLRGGATQ
jgi:hypothetical protein